MNRLGTKPSRPSLMAAVTAGLPVAARDVFLTDFLDTPAMEPWRNVFYFRVCIDKISRIQDPTVSWRTLPVMDVLGPYDLADHPIVPQLRAWLAAAVAVTDPADRPAPPVFPVPADADPRPPIDPMPEGCGPLERGGGGESEEDLFYRLITGTVLFGVMKRFRVFYKSDTPRPLAAAVHPDRVRCYQEGCTYYGGWLTFDELATIFGWKLQSEFVPILYLTKAAMDRNGVVAMAPWFNRDSNQMSFFAPACLSAMRLAVVVWDAMLRGGLTHQKHCRLVGYLRVIMQRQMDLSRY